MAQEPMMMFACLTVCAVVSAASVAALDWWLHDGEQLRRDAAEWLRLRRLGRDLAELLEDE